MNVSGNLENILIELFFSWLLTEFEASKLLFCNAKLRCQVVNALPSERVWPSNMSSCPES